MRRAILSCFLLILAACDSLPRDAGGTTKRIEATGEMRVALMPGTPDANLGLAVAKRYASRLGAKIRIMPIHGEHGFRALDDGRVDLLVGHFAKASPFQSAMSLSRPVGRDEPEDGKQPVLRIARRNGENALILATDGLVADNMR